MTLASPQPDEKPLAIGSVACFILSIGGTFVGTGLNWFVGGGNAEVFLYTAAGILSNISTICFCLLLRRIGRNISSSSLEKAAYSMLVWYEIFFAICIGAGVAVAMSSFQSAALWLWVSSSIAIVIVALIILLKYLAMLRSGITELKPR